AAVQHVCLTHPHLRGREVVCKRRHAGLCLRAVPNDLLEESVCRSRGIAQVGDQGAAGGVAAMAASAKCVVQYVSVFDLFWCCRDRGGGHGNGLRRLLVGRQPCRATEGECQEMSRRDLPATERPILENRRSAPTRQYRNVLCVANGVCHRARGDADSAVEFPEHLAIGRAVSAKLAIGASLEGKVAGGAQRSAALWVRVLDAPHLALRYRVPSHQRSA